MTFYVVVECDYSWDVFALLQSHTYSLSKIWDAVQDWIDTKESIWKQGSKNSVDSFVPLRTAYVHKYVHS